METLYADTANVAEALNRVEQHTDVGDEEMQVSVHDSEAVMRGITIGEVKDRNLDGHLGEQVCRFKYDGTRLTLGFHQKQVDGEFRLRPASVDALPPVRQTNDVKEIAPNVGRVCRRVEDEFDVISYDFMEVSAGSMASGGHFTSFEFEYAVTSMDF